ncbi:hypothetical protein GQ464_009205 [Rhodocaloribacter litoris]|uniref:hypothetical protein n=1 Tax=Rhodocaloribacter litoris TaxID=2558931 RepID=UPI00141EF899|nr:hypothetical protein [Rhodocaloribacter litoris]QXD17084.1 hypothetical protein GQ464_009205 [Rhodocaloribacter litoris]
MFTTDPDICRWLASLGYELEGRSRSSLEALFLREAQQWELPPPVLAALIRDEGLKLDATGRAVRHGEPVWSSLAA